MSQKERLPVISKALKSFADFPTESHNVTMGMSYIDTNYVVKWSGSMSSEKTFGNDYVPGEICYKKVFGRDEPCVRCAFTEMMQTGKSVSHEIEYEGNYVEVTAYPSLDNNGVLCGGIIKFDNITRMKDSQRKLRELNRLMQVILDNVPVYIFVKDPNNEFRYLYWNKAFEGHSGIPAERVIGKTDWEVFPKAEDAEHFRQDDTRLLEGGEPIEFDEVYVASDGRNRYVHTVKITVPSDDKLPWVMGISWDITDLKQNQEELIEAKNRAEESDRLKSSFIANMGHEIRTPLNAIVGFSELLVDHNITPQEGEEYVSIIQKNNKLLLQLISDILDLSKIEAKMLDFNYDMVDINDLCNRVVTLYSNLADTRVPVVFTPEYEKLELNTDENRVHQVLTNLVNNALKFTVKGEVRLTAKVEGDVLTISVCDTGTGIPADKLSSVFERFVKLNSFVQGTGLGLAICKNLVEQLGGEIGVESQVDQGSRFWFTLPMKR